jgi:methylthioribose-1-phosphate isomerase
MKSFSSTGLKVDARGIWVLDQTQLPQKEVWLESPTPEAMIGWIQGLKIRGAPLIGVAAAVQLGWLAEQRPTPERFEKALWALREARPTAVNLMNAMDRMLRVWKADGLEAVVSEAENIWHEDVELAERMALNGARLIQDGERLLTHCNTGGLATVGIGTALGAIIKAWEQGKKIHVYVDETRPLLQGGRLNTWELSRHKIPFTLICDNMAASLMAQGKIDRALVGRIALP